jgi:hypothetical protein
MHRMRHLLMLLLLGMVLSSCANTPRSLDESDAVLKLRKDYLRSNPAGKFNGRIEKGEIVRGMNFMEVLASWGVPQCRRSLPEKEIESWIYIGKDEESKDWQQYTLMFEKRVLVQWDVMRHNSKNGSLAQWSIHDQTDIDLSEPPQRTTELSKKKR